MSRQVASSRNQRRRGRIARGVAAATLGLAPLALASAASAHVTVTPSTTEAGASAILTVSIGHGCAGSPTTAVEIKIPDDVYSVTPTRNPLWDVSVKSEPVVPPVTDEHGTRITDRVASVTYRTDTPLPDGQRDTFELSLHLPATVDETLVFPTIQTCEKGESAWIEVPAKGRDADELDLPAPSFVLTGAGTDPAVQLVAGDDGGVAQTATTSSDGSSLLALAAFGVGVVGVLLGLAALTRLRRQS